MLEEADNGIEMLEWARSGWKKVIEWAKKRLEGTWKELKVAGRDRKG